MTVRPTLGERSAVVSDCGRRAVNQDAVLVTGLPDGGELVAVADGMGGHSAGEIASRLALEVLHAELAAGAGLEEAVRAANSAVFKEAGNSADRVGMGTTLVALVRRGDAYVIANVGDSRAYRVDERSLRQLTEDHSFVAEAVRSGQLTAADAEKSRWRNAVTRAVGTERDLTVDCFGPFDATEPHAVLLCTDGLYRSVCAGDLHETVLRAGEPAHVVQELASTAFQAGADDNISVALIEFGPGLAAGTGGPALTGPRIVRFEDEDPFAATASSPMTPVAVAPVAPPATAPEAPVPVDERRPRQPRRPAVRRLKTPGSWTTVQLLIILSGIIAITVYVLLLWLVL